ncbi:MAG: hypothetical protein JWM11_1325 [Planctomycetaceae bacterium]|nr:hypothetical protein [Planctomycetaceae bacterium]
MWSVNFRIGIMSCVGFATAWLALASIFADETSPVDKTDPKYALTDPDGKDQDFHLTGEFAGTAQLSRFGSQTFGLQVVAMGNGRFQGRLLIGGLPAAGWNGFAQIRLTGERDGRRLTLLGGPYTVTLAGIAKSATVRYKDGDLTLGVLPRQERQSPTMNATVPAGGNLLFQGGPDDICGTYLWNNAHLTEEKYLKAGAETYYGYRDFKLHVEFRTPFMPNARGQSRGNSGIYLNGRHEIQILDSFALAGGEDDCGAIYRSKRPDVNMTLPPLAWQTYDITYNAPVFNAKGKKVENALVTVLHNGVLIHDKVEIEGQTGLHAPEESDELMAIKLQDHGTPVVFRNIWIAPIEDPNATVVQEPYYGRRGRRR